MTAEHARVVRVTRYTPSEGRDSELLEHLRRVQEMASEAEGCFGAQTCTSKEDRGVLVAISRWESEQALERFMDGPPMKEAMSGASGLFQGQQVEHFVST